MSEYRYCVGTFTRRTGSGNQTVPVSDANGDFTPKAVIMWGTVQTDDGFENTSQFAVGWTDGISYMSIANYTDDNGVTGQTRCAVSNSDCPIVNTAAPTIISDSAGSFVFSSGSFRLTWNGAGEPDALWNFLAVGGADLIVKAGHVLAPATLGEQITSVPGIGQITGILFSQPRSLNGSLGVAGVANANLPTVGWADASRQAACATHVDELTSGAAGTFRAQRTDRAIYQFQGGIGTGIIAQASVVSLGVNEFTLDWLQGTNPDGLFDELGTFYLAFSGPRISAGIISGITIPLSFFPGAIIAQTIGGVPSATVQTNLRYSFGISDGINQANSWIGVQSNVNPSVTARRMQQNQILTCATPLADAGDIVPTIQASVLFDARNVILDYQGTDPLGTELLYFAMEIGPAPPPPVNPSSGIYRLERGQRHDTLYINDGEGTEDVKIPNPFAQTAYLGDEE